MSEACSAATPPAAGALEGVRILDLSTVLMGPYATQMLGDLGADVIKVEAPDGDRTRYTGLGRSPSMSGWFMNFNRSKRSLAIDLKAPQGREVLLDLVGTADVLLYNIRPAAMERLGLSYADVSARNPAILYVGALGFGREGPYAGLPAFDDLIQAATGLPWLFQYAGAAEPRFAPSPLVDRLVGSQVAMNIVAGLLARTRTGRGQQIDVPMFETMASVMLGDHLGGEAFEPEIGPWGYRRMLAAERRPYRTRDGYIAALPYYREQWSAFFRSVGRSELFESDARFSDPVTLLRNVNVLYSHVADILLERTSEEWLALFRKLDIAAMVVKSIEDLMEDPQIRAAGLLVETEHPTEGVLREVAPPARWSDTPAAIRRHAPNIGEQSREILGELGYDDDKVSKLLGAGVVREWTPPAARDERSHETT